MSDNSKVAIIIVFYNPTTEMVRRASLLNERYSVYVVDNSANALKSKPVFNYFPLYKNLGIGAAQNVAISHLEGSEKYVLFLDQDSDMAIDEIAKLEENFKKIEISDDRLAAVGPIPIDISKGTPYKSVFKERQGKHVIHVDALISSGTFTKTILFKRVGLFESNLFIDYVDFEWCWRVINQGYHIYMTDEVELRHQVGNYSYSIWGVAFIKSAPFRYYYRFRNYGILVRRKYVPLNWKLRTFIHNLMELLMVVIWPIYKGERVIILKNILKGTKDGFKKTETNICIS